MGLYHCTAGTAALLVSEVQNNWKLEGWKRGRANDDDISSPEALLAHALAHYHLSVMPCLSAHRQSSFSPVHCPQVAKAGTSTRAAPMSHAERFKSKFGGDDSLPK